MEKRTKRVDSIESEYQFDSLPLTLVELQLFMSEHFSWSFQQVFDIRESVSKRHPELSAVDVPTQVSINPSTGVSFKSNASLPFVLFGPESRLSITFQNQALGVRWISRGIEHRDRYPGFGKLLKLLEDAISILGDVCGPELPDFKVAHITYEDFVSTESHPRIADYSNYLVRDLLPYSHDEDALFYGWTASWQAYAGIDYRIELRSVVPDEKGGSTGFLVRAVGGTVIGNKEEWSDSISAVHSEVRRLFPELITDRAKEEWGYHG